MRRSRDCAIPSERPRGAVSPSSPVPQQILDEAVHRPTMVIAASGERTARMEWPLRKARFEPDQAHRHSYMPQLGSVFRIQNQKHCRFRYSVDPPNVAAAKQQHLAEQRATYGCYRVASSLRDYQALVSSHLRRPNACDQLVKLRSMVR